MISLVAPPRLADRRMPSLPPKNRCESSRDVHQREAQHRARAVRSSRHDDEARLLQYSGRMLAVARRMLRSEEDAADAVQDAFMSAFASIHQFRASSQINTWLHRIVVNACLMKLRSQKRRTALSLDALLPLFDEDGNHAQPTCPWPDRAIEQVERKETRAIVRERIDMLPSDYRTILILRDIEELDTDETSAVLGISRAAVKTRLHRARQMLRSLLEPVFVDDNADVRQTS